MIGGKQTECNSSQKADKMSLRPWVFLFWQDLEAKKSLSTRPRVTMDLLCFLSAARVHPHPQPRSCRDGCCWLGWVWDRQHCTAQLTHMAAGSRVSSPELYQSSVLKETFLFPKIILLELNVLSARYRWWVNSYNNCLGRKCSPHKHSQGYT